MTVRAVVQRVQRASVTVDDAVVGEIGRGLLVLIGAGRGDDIEDVDYLVDKVINLRVFEDSEAKMNLSLRDVDGELLVVSQFTLYGDARKGRRPSFADALEPVAAARLYERFLKNAREQGVRRVEAGRFGAMMAVELLNWGPVTLLLDSRRGF
jgi:D-aminoacyl-tRNA deacylase